MTANLKKFLKLKKQYDLSTDEAEQDALIAQMDELYFELNDEEVAYLESRELNNS